MTEIMVNNELTLKIPAADDADEIYQLVADSRETLAKWLPWATKETLEIQRQFLKENIKKFNEKQAMVFGIQYHDKYAGLIGFNTINQKLKQTEIGYWLTNDFVGHGIMQQSLKALIRYGFNNLQLKKLILKIAVDNDRSNHVAKKAGFTLNRVIPNGLDLNDGYHDENEWILKKEADLNP
ncbi:GNAT family N-acetyltransferase [Fructilactobacillus sp. Tb1]|uniref:GNAT family N-acetyltransferase n=1 Tax=Fructilactobacillus sp. Tb1 TaxID=3422304 RepID=UPI003D29301C